MDQALHDELISIQGKLDALNALLPMVQKHDRILLGNGERGLVLKVDRLEETEKRHRWVMGIMAAGIVPAIIEWVGKLWKL